MKVQMESLQRNECEREKESIPLGVKKRRGSLLVVKARENIS